ncbi:MAG: exodeoxyribonuclease III [Gammaproteobacteria bacterium RIFCSPHIGHO2_12_FULL_37_14]|nr:MAG: exodeoxyribonuclease III [Gammaproteobacteria bacterium RIFCSPHIGHO2_12_FULL_37_14]
MTFKIATWNVNSLRVRLPHVLTWLNDVQPDVLALQEIKLSDPEFPFDAIQEAGYTAVCSGQRTYNGVAIISRQEVRDIVTEIPGFDDQQRRILGVTFNDIRILNIYIPNGESIVSEKYQYKLRWLKNFDSFLRDELKKYPKLIVVGDFNIAPDEIDVHDPARWQGQVLFSDLERQAFREMLQAGFSDCFRQINTTEKKFSWWDYRLNAYRRNLGMRIDHILASTALSLNCHHCSIDTAPRAWERPSDHAPVVAEFR